MKSLKSRSSCLVCKVAYRHRESMEIASGVNVKQLLKTYNLFSVILQKKLRLQVRRSITLMASLLLNIAVVAPWSYIHTSIALITCILHHKLVICCSALTVEEKDIVSEFEESSGVTVLKKWNSSITHVIASTDENEACRRTLKILMGVLEGMWISNIAWVKACLKSMELVDEENVKWPWILWGTVHDLED
ncbi:hypothetical protein SLEP1_g16057 [Rubroshorea leprosula]|uniref:BRCT domain-containing protein n=1 Tax=Rubroshorea leprosula TaxID=152421 RepID=A0AAV5IPH7_9ROSI|nr:hypothetical protein SLEP1_g16057 [Rubroshorea leprosula]